MGSLKSHNNKATSINEVRGRLFELIFNMSNAEAEELLKKLEYEKESKHEVQEKRKYPRKSAFIAVDCLGYNCKFTDFIQNLSVGGLYIETQIPLFVGQELSISFFPLDNEILVKITGSIVRIDEKGIGIQFNEPLASGENNINIMGG